jgi:hypothetical protein
VATATKAAPKKAPAANPSRRLDQNV